jgi:hypothetical protein
MLRKISASVLRAALAVAFLTLLTAWTPTVQAQVNCTYSVESSTPSGGGVGLGTDDLGNQFTYKDLIFECSSGTEPCDGPITACWSLAAYNSSCVLGSVFATGNNTWMPGVVGCDGDWPGFGESAETFVYLPNPPGPGQGYYNMKLEIRDGGTCSGTAIMTTYNSDLYYNSSTDTWSLKNCTH